MAELRQAVAEHGRYLDRPVAEESPEWKQVIPYVVVRDGELTFLMERTSAGGDPRLHRKASIGVGGHLNPVDAGEDPLQGGLRREWAEELEADWEPEFHLLGLLNDDTNPVGSVHLGVVFQVDAAGRPRSRAGDRQAERTDGRCIGGGGGLGAARDVVPAGGHRAARSAQRELAGVMRILDGCFDCGGLSRSVPCCWAPSRWPCPRSRRTTTSCASSCRV